MEFLTYLDESNIAYLLMIVGFLVMTRMSTKVIDENKRLRRLLREVVKHHES